MINDLPAEVRKGKWGMITNDAARLASTPETRTRKAFLDAGINLTCLFSPEHGLTAKADDGESIPDGHDTLTELPVYSIYGNTLRPPVKILRELDGVIFDLPEVGTRFYTYLWALSHVMDACEYCDIPLIIPDRPNPLGGDLAMCEGPILDTRNCRSYMGRAPLPIRYGLTVGEFARWLKNKWDMNLLLHVIPVDNWKRSQQWPDTDLKFIPPSPSIHSFESALCYPGICFFEATNLSLGRGTDAPFQQVGSPWLDPVKVLSLLRSFDLPGTEWHKTSFTPEQDLWKGEPCNGVRLIITDRHALEPVRTGLTLLAVIRNLYNTRFQWKPYSTVSNPSGKNHFELLVGQYYWRTELEDDPVGFIEELPDRLTVPGWKEEAEPWLLYS